jgi:hypothetical protein
MPGSPAIFNGAVKTSDSTFPGDRRFFSRLKAAMELMDIKQHRPFESLGEGRFDQGCSRLRTSDNWRRKKPAQNVSSKHDTAFHSGRNLRPAI